MSQYYHIEFRQQIRDFNYDASKFAPLVNVFRAKNTTAQTVKPRELVARLNSVYSIGLDTTERNMLADILGLLPEDLLLGLPDGEKQSLLEQVNLLPIIQQVEGLLAENKSDVNSVIQKKLVNSLASIRSKVLSSYIEQERASLLSTMTDQQIADLGPEKMNAQLTATVTNPNYVPVVGRGTEPAPLSDESLTPTMDKSLPWMTQVETGISAGDTFESILRRNPESSILDIANLEKNQEASYGAFDVTDFESWMYSGRPTSSPRRPNFWGSKVTNSNLIPAANKKTWSAYEAINYVYQLNEKGDTTKIKEIQEMLLQAGYVSPDSDYGLPVPGILDQATVVGWNMFLTEAARAKETPKDFWLKQVNERKAIRAGRVAIESPVDPLKTAAAFQQTAMDVLGRQLSGAEERALFSKLNEWQREIMTFGLEATDKPFDFDARIESYIRNRNQEEIMMRRMAELPAFLEEWFG